MGELYHHGVPGMKWGIRKSRSGSTGSNKAKKKRAADGSKPKNTEQEKKTSKSMTDEELRKKINRKRLENDYNTLYPAKVSAGKKIADTVINKVIVPAAIDAGKQVARDFLVNQGKKALKLPTGGGNKDKD